MPTVSRRANAPVSSRGTTPALSTADMTSAKIESTVVDPKEADKARKSIFAAEQAPTLAEQTPDQNTWQANRDTLGPPFDVERITLAQCRQIRKDPMVSFGLHYRKVPMVRNQWHIDARDKNGPNPQVAAFVDSALRLIYARLIFQRTLAWDFGFQGIAKRFIFQNPGGTYVDPTVNDIRTAQKPAWDEGDILPVIWKAPVALKPEQVTPAFDDRTGEFSGMLYDVPPAQRNKASGFKASSQKGNQAQRQIDVYHSYWGTNQKDQEHGSVYGYPLVAYARDYWWAYRFLFMLANRAYERLAIPPVLAYHPPGSTLVDAESGEMRPNWQIALEAAERLRSNAVAAVPSTMASAGLDSSATQREWDFTFMDTPWESLTVFDARFNYLNMMKLRSVWVPDLAFIGGNQGGGNTGGNIAEQMSEVLTEGLAIEMDDIDDEINRLWIPQLLTINMPDFIANGGVAKKVSHGFRSEDTEFNKQIIQLLGQARPDELDQVDLAELFRRNGTPLKSADQQAAERDALAAQQSAPPPVTPTTGNIGVIANPNANAGTTNGGSSPQPGGVNGNGAAVGFDAGSMLYVAGREHIELAEVDDFVASLPATAHYSDKAIRALMLQLRRLWLGHYRNLFPDFASHVATAKLNLSDVDLDNDEFREINADSLSMMFAIGGARKAGDKITVVTKKAATKAANALMRSWTQDNAKLDDLRKKSGDLIAKIAKRAAELQRKEGSFENSINDDTLNEWLDRQTGRLIKLTSGSVKNELRDFLINNIRAGKTADDIADEIRAHYSGFEGHKADRVARSETRDAVNAATLITAEANGVRYVRANDGEEFDEDCKKRNGKLFTVREAWNQVWKEHPYGTLGFQPIARANFSIEHVHQMPDNAPDDAGLWFDNETSTAYIMLCDEIDGDTADEWLGRVGNALVS